MIRYTLKCANGHRFDAWYRDSGAFDALSAAGQLACSVCGDTDVTKAVMAPAIGGSAEEAPLSTPSNPLEAKLKGIREKLEREADYVGPAFASEARRIHDGDREARPIWGEASLSDAKKLVDDGVPVAPLPLIGPRRGDA